MATSKLPASIASTYPDSSSDRSIGLHQRHHDLIHRIVNAFDVALDRAAPGDALRWDGTAYAPAPSGRLRVNKQGRRSYTLRRDDADALVAFTHDQPCTLVIPPQSSLPLPVGTQVHVAQLGPGQVSITPSAGVAVNGVPGLKLLDQYAGAGLVKVGDDSWWVVGRLAA